jgi:tetratricopeptide (TPR) repeat protein
MGELCASLNNLAHLYQAQGRYGEAEPLYQQALATSERVLGAEDPDTLTSLNNLASLYRAQGRYGEAEPLYQHALATSERILGAEHSFTLTSRTVRPNLEVNPRLR